MSINEILDYELFSAGDYTIHLIEVIRLFFLIVISWIVVKVISRLIQRRVKSGKFDKGRGHAFFQILRYMIIIMTILFGMDMVGIKLTLLLAGSAALLVGIGLGLQQVFNDIVSGILLLFEGTVTVGDIVELNSVIGKVKAISIRTSRIETRDKIIIIVPNSKLVSDNVINWSHSRRPTRFKINVGVAYGSDVPLVMRLLCEAASQHADVEKTPEPIARFSDFGESSLDFELLFFCKKMFDGEFIRSDIRVAIDEKFRKNNVTIPFPQRDLHLKDGFTISNTSPNS